jgi:transcriptional regulator NrdR family protein
MKCPCCSEDTKSLVKETRKQGGELARRRECTACGESFFTREYHDPEFVLRKPREASKARKRTNNNDLFKVWR